MAISFNSVPSNLRVPFVAVEVDNSRASQGPALLSYKALLVGQKTSAGTAAANSLHRVTSADQVLTLAGRGSLLHRMAIAWFAANKSTETYIGVVEDNGAGVAATGKVVFAGTATADGVVSYYIGNDRVDVAVSTGDTAADVAAALVDAVGENLDLPVTAAVDGSVDEEVDFTFLHKGTAGNELKMRVNYQDGEELPAGITATITQLASGATNPVLTSLIAAMADEWFQVIAHPYTDATSLTALENELADRFGPMRMIDGVAFTAKNDSVANMGTLGDGRNSPHSAIFATQNSPTPSYEYAAHAAGVIAYHAQIDPARPFQTLPLPYVLAPVESDRFSLEERNQLLFDGISTTKVAAGDMVQLERSITTYKTNAAGASDTSYLDVTSMLTLLYLRFSFRNQILSRYPRHKLANDGGRYGAGQKIITPKIGKAEAVLWFRQMEELGLVEGFDQFKADLVVERNPQDPNRLDFLLPPDLINQFIVAGVQLQFRL